MLTNIYKSTSARLLLPCIGLFCEINKAVAQLQLPLSKTSASQKTALVATLRQGIASRNAICRVCTEVEIPAFVLTQATPPAISPGTIEPTRQGTLPPLPQKLPPSTPKALEPTQPPPRESSPAIETKIEVKKVEVLGSTVFSAEELAEVAAPFVGKEASFEQLLEIRTAVTNLYTSRGYTTSGAFLPLQDISEGAIAVQVVEGELERIEVRGLNRLQNSYVRRHLEIATQTPINIGRLESALQLLQLNPLFSRVQAELTAGTAPGRNILIVNLKEALPLSSALIVDNRDSPSVGSIRGAAVLSHNNLLGLGDRLSVEAGISEGVEDYSISYDLPVNARNGTLSFRYDNGNSRMALR